MSTPTGVYNLLYEHGVSKVALLWGWFAYFNRTHEYLVCEAPCASVSSVVDCVPSSTHVAISFSSSLTARGREAKNGYSRKGPT